LKCYNEKNKEERMKPVIIRKMPVEDFIEILKEGNIEASAEEVTQLLNFIYHFSTLLVKEFLECDISIN